MKIELMENYPDEVKDYVREYNLGVDHKDINTVNLSINSLVQLLFSANDKNRMAATHALDQIAKIQPGFLKAAVKTLLFRYNGEIEEKKKLAGEALKNIFIGKAAEKLIPDEEVKRQLKAEKEEIAQKKAQQEAEEAKLVQKIKRDKIDLDFLNPFPEIKSIGQYYNNSLLNNQLDVAQSTVNDLVENLFIWAQEDLSKFMPGCMLLGKMASKEYRRPFIQSVINEIQKKYYQGGGVEKDISGKILENILDEAFDILQPAIANELKAKRQKRKKERLQQKKAAKQKADEIKKIKVPVSVGWVEEVKEIGNLYNEAIVSDKKEKLYKKALKKLTKLLEKGEGMEFEHANELFSMIVSKNPDLVQETVYQYLGNPNDQNISLVLQKIVGDLERYQWANPEKINAIRTAKNARIQKEKEEMEQLREKHEKIKAITIQIDGNWHKKVTEAVEELNSYILDDDKKKIAKAVDDEIKKLIYAKDDDIREEGKLVFTRIAQKYPKYIFSLLKEELVPLYLSDHEQRTMAIELFGTLYEHDLTENLFKDAFPEVYNTIEEEWANRKQEMENLMLQKKIDAIKADVTQLRIKDDWDKRIKKIARQYNTGIKNKEKKEIMEAIEEIVDIHMKDRNDQRKRQATDVLGLIAKKNIELIQPTIQMFLQLIDKSNDKDEKTQAIIGLGEVTKQRPGWAYFGIEKLIKITQNDPSEYFRMKALLELSKIGKKSPTMLIEHLDPLINCLRKDPNKNVRRLAAMTLGNMSDALTIEADRVLPALRDALHDEYILVRKFADRALTEIRKSMRT